MYVITISAEDLNELNNVLNKEIIALEERAKSLSKTFYNIRKKSLDSLTKAVESAEEKSFKKQAPEEKAEISADFDKIYIAKGKKVIKTISLKGEVSPLDDIGVL